MTEDGEGDARVGGEDEGHGCGDEEEYADLPLVDTKEHQRGDKELPLVVGVEGKSHCCSRGGNMRVDCREN